jgi:alpha-tubulin suppressor-like RCC1 family protein
VTSGLDFSCALKPDGTLACWGRTFTLPADTLTQVDAGFTHVCALKPNGSIVCWGDNNYGQLDGIPTGTFTQVSAGFKHSCALKSDGSIACWGANDYGQLDGIPAGTFTQVSAGFTHSCALKSDGSIACWGANDYGQAAPPTGTFTQVSAGDYLTCALKSDGAIACWGRDYAGEPVSAPPSNAPGDYGAPSVSAGLTQSCALKADGTITCWGRDDVGLLDAPAGTFTQLSASAYGTCALASEGTLACWGIDVFGLGTNAPAGTFTQVDAGFDHMCALKAGGTLVCWGNNSHGLSTPPAGTFTQVSAGSQHSCALKTDGAVVCWGDNLYGEATPPGGTYTQVSAGAAVTCALKTDGTLACWGEGGTPDVTSPPAGTFTQVSLGGIYGCALRTDGTLACWGSSAFGLTTPPAGTFRQLSAGVYHACAVRTDGAIICWGRNDFGQADVPPQLAGVISTTTTVSVSPTSQQYSDSVTLAATVLPATATGTVQFAINGNDVGTPVTLGPDGTAALTIQVTLGAQDPAAAYGITATFTPDTGSSFAASSGMAASGLTVSHENATVHFADANPAALQVSSAGGTLAAGALTLNVYVQEQTPDAAHSPGAAGFGDIAKAGIGVALYPVGPGSGYTLACSAGAVSGSGYSAVRSFTCTNAAAIAVNAYEVDASVTGAYYTGAETDAFTVYDPSLGFATGGGIFRLGGDRVNFGFTMQYKKNGRGAQGNFIAVRHHADGTTSRLKSNALGNLALGTDANVPMGWASFDGKATYTTWDASAGEYVTVGNQQFTVYAEDRNDPGSGTDRIWLAGSGSLTMPGTPSQAQSNAASLTGGNIAIPHKADGKGRR